MAIETLPFGKSTRSTAVPENAPQKPKKKSRRTLWLIIGSSGAFDAADDI
jgi:hypothetical protein